MGASHKSNSWPSRQKQSNVFIHRLPLLLAHEVPAFRAARRGQWIRGTKHETPAEYKRRYIADKPSDSVENRSFEPEKPASAKAKFFGRWWKFVSK